MNKARSQRIHAKRRAGERYGDNFNRLDLQAIIRLVQTNQYISAKRLTNTRTEVTLVYNGKEYRLVYDKLRKNICTFLPRERHEHD